MHEGVAEIKGIVNCTSQAARLNEKVSLPRLKDNRPAQTHGNGASVFVDGAYTYMTGVVSCGGCIR